MSILTYNNKFMTPGIISFLNDVIGDDLVRSEKNFKRELVPAVNVKENESTYVLEMAVPGFDKKDINVEIEEDLLVVSSKKEIGKKEENEKFTRREFYFNSFKRSFNIPENADVTNIEAKQENGMLFISIPKKEVKSPIKKLINVS